MTVKQFGYIWPQGTSNNNDFIFHSAHLQYKLQFPFPRTRMTLEFIPPAVVITDYRDGRHVAT
jgi:hypothetical protein